LNIFLYLHFKIKPAMSNTTKKIKAFYHRDAKHYTIHAASGRYYARRITEFSWNFWDSDKYKDLGNTKGFEDAMMLVKLDATSFGHVIQYEIDD